MSTHVPSCPSPNLIEALAQRPPGPGDTAHDALVAHVSRCPDCAEALRAARFANRFSRVLLGQEQDQVQGDTLPVIPGYRVEREISRGAQGVVYEAVQIKSGQRVAVKLLHERGHASPTSGARFGREIQIAGALSHPGIVRLLDSMVLADGSDALIMERINGVAMLQWLAGNPRPTREQIVDAIASVADALHHAHQRGVIHRDLKPANILIDENGATRVLDFGIARWTDATREQQRVTMTGEFAGTLAYAAPEQVGGVGGEHRAAADIRSDIYALGVIAYEALTGSMPYAVHGSLETAIWNIVHAEPARATMQGLGTDLAIVLAKAIAKEPERRYQTAADFARDLRHAVRGEAIDARRDSRIYMLRKSIRRHRFGVAVGAMVVLFAMVMLVVLAVSNARLSHALRESRIERLRTLAATGSRAKAEEILWDELRNVEPKRVRSEERGAMAGLWSGELELRRCVWAFMELQGRARCVSKRSMGVRADTRILPAGSERMVVVQGSSADFRSMQGDVIGPRVELPGESSLLASTPDWRYVLLYRDGAVETWEVVDASIRGPVAMFPIARSDEQVPILEARNHVAVVSSVGQTPIVLSVPDLTLLSTPSEAMENQRAWISADSQTVIYLARDGTLREIEPSGAERRRRRIITPEVVAAASPRVGARIAVNEQRTRAVAMLSTGAYVLDLAGSGEGVQLESRGATRSTAGISPSGDVLAVASFGDSRLRLFDATSLEEVASLTGHDRTVGIHGFTNGGSQVVTIDSRFDLRVWDAPGHGWRTQITEATPHALDPAMSRDGELLFFGSVDRRLNVIRLTDPAAPPVEISPALALSVACSRDGEMVASAAQSDSITICRTDGTSRQSVRAVPGGRIHSLRFDPDGSRLAMGTMEGTVAIVRTSDAEVEHRIEIVPKASIASVRFVGETGLLAVAARDGRVHLLRASTLEPVRTVDASEGQIRSIAISPDAQTIAAVGDSGQILLIDVSTGRVRPSPRVSEDAIFCIAFHPSGKTILVGDRAGLVTVVDAQVMAVLATFDVNAPVTSLLFDAAGDQLVVSAIGHPIERWDFAALAQTLEALRPDHQ